MTRVLILLSLLCFVSPLKAAPYLFTLDSGVDVINITPKLEVMEDKTTRLSLQHLLKNHNEFINDWQQSKDIGYSLSAWWVRFDVVNNDPNNRYWYLQLQNLDANSLQVYAFPTSFATNNQAIPVIHELRRASFRLELPQSSQYSIYLRIKNSNRPLVFNLQLVSADFLVKSSPKDHIFYAFVLGGLLIMSIYNLLTFFSLKELTYLSLAIFIISNCIGLSSQSGMLSVLFYNVDVEYIHAICALLTVASGNSFFYQLMSIPCRLTIYANLFKIHFWITVFFILIIHFLNFKIFYPSILGGFLFLLAVPVIFVLYREKIPEARSFVWAFAVILLSCIPIIFYGLGLFKDWVVALNLLMLGFLLFIVLLSLTQSMRTRELRDQAQQIEASSKAKDAFLMTMSHELRTPMHAVVSSGALLRQTRLTAQQNDYVEKLQASAEHMLNLINNILDVSRISHAESEVKSQPFSLQSILESLEKLLGDQARNKGLKFELISDYPINNWLMGDSIRLSQILLNLLDNAVKFTDIGFVKLKIKTVGQWLDKIELEFIVTDTGLGLSLKEQERLFEPFFQANSSINRRHTGTGLGLTISHNLVKRLGGELKVKSKPEQGASFSFRLSFTLAKQEAELLVPSIRITYSYQDKKVLLVDDDLLNQFFGKELLESLGVQVELASSGQEAMIKLKENFYDLIFMDVSMPDLDGYQTTQLIRSELQLRNLPIVALTAHAISGERERCLSAGMDDYLAKPFSIHDLEAMLIRWLLN